MASNGKLLTLKEIVKHNKNNDCWLIINGKVYDVTPFMNDHPGGDEVLLAATGKDATDDFEDIGHSDSAREHMEKYYVGEIDSSTLPTKRTYTQPQQQIAAKNSDKNLIKFLQFLVPIFILGVAFAVRHYYSNEM